MLWSSCEGSRSAIDAATIQAKIISGRYRDIYLLSKFSTNVPCMVSSLDPSVMHYLSGNCLPLSDKLFDYLRKSLNILSSHPHLLPPVHSVLDKSEDDWAFFIVDPITNSQVIQLKQECGEESVWLNYRLSRAYIWCMHRERAKLISN